MDADERAEEIDRIAKMASHLYHELGLPVIPIHHPWEPIPPHLADTWDRGQTGKRAMVGWKEYQESMPEEGKVKDWFFTGRNLFNIGIPTGVSSHTVVVDCDSSGATAWSSRNLEATPMVCLTSEGLDGFRKSHHYYARPERVVRNQVKIHTDAGNLAMDIRADGGYVLAPGSRHASGMIYEEQDLWTPEMLDCLPPLPDRLIELPKRAALADRQGYTDNPRIVNWARHYLAPFDPAIEGEGGDTATYKAMCKIMAKFPLTDQAVFDVFTEWNLRCSPPWRDPHLWKKLRNARTYGQDTRWEERGILPFPTATAGGATSPNSAALDEVVALFGGGPQPVPEVIPHPSSPATGYVFLSNVERRLIGHLLKPYIPKKEITLVSGPGGRGKSLGVASIAAHVSTGKQLGGMDVEQGPVLFFSAEDDADSVLQPRLHAAAADLSNIVVKKMNLGSQFILDQAGLTEIELAVEMFRPKLLIIDPIVNFMANHLDMNRSNEVASILKPLVGLAQDADLAVIVVCHHNKQDDIMGSQQFWNTSRSVLSCYEDPVDRTGSRRYFAHRKSNYTRLGASLHYEIRQQMPGDDQLIWAHFLAPDAKWPADRLIAAQATGMNREQVRMAEQYLEAELRARRKKAKEILSGGRGIGIRSDILLIAKERLGIEMSRSDDTNGEWYWSLP
jgi:hypothetical protein